jgi:hypothetical protein
MSDHGPAVLGREDGLDADGSVVPGFAVFSIDPSNQ